MSLYTTKVSRSEILGIVKQNKEKHDQLLKEAIEGYWISAENKLKEYEKNKIEELNTNYRKTLKQLKKEHKDQLKRIKDQVHLELGLVNKKEKEGYSIMKNPFPEDHGDDYEGIIKRLELTVDDNLELDKNEFDSYIRNKWAWKDSFIKNNLGYARALYSDEKTALIKLGKDIDVKSRSEIINSGLTQF